jgi:L-glyceraldehyde 3-phosphate reductase
LLDVLDEEGLGCIVFSPLAQGLLTDKYLHGIPEGSRASKKHFLKPEHITDDKLERIRALNELAAERGQTLAQMAVAWTLRHRTVTSAIIGASRPAHIDDAVGALAHLEFPPEQLARIDAIVGC